MTDPILCPTLSGMGIRHEWVKMFYPDMPKGIPVGVLHQWGPGIWVLYRRTDDTAYNAQRDSPMGLDAGTLKYLRALDNPPLFVDFHAEGATEFLRLPLDEFTRWPAQLTLTTKNAARNRIFVPSALWHPLAPYARDPGHKSVLPFWQVTHLQEDGTVMGRFVDRGFRR